MSPVITLIGAGNMGSSLIVGLIKNGHPREKIWASDTSTEKLTELSNNFSIHTTTDNKIAISQADVIVFAIKPQLFAAVAKPLAALIQKRKPLVISIAAGISEAGITSCLGTDTAIVRAMPNTPALVGCGATALHANPNVNAVQRNMAETILSTVGIVVWLENEDLMNTVTALSGSGPAYFFLMMEALQQAAEDLGLPKAIAHQLTLQTALGSARMAMESGKGLDELRRNVTSPGGTTEKAVSLLEKDNLRGIFKHAIHAAKVRAEELATLME